MKSIQGVGEYDVGFATTWTGGNYGGLLTQLSMYRILKDYGLKVLMIERPKTAELKPSKRTELYWNYPYPENELEEGMPDIKAMRQINDRCKMFMVASDQLFNNYLYQKCGRFITLDWVRNNKRKIAYSVSFGFDYIFGPEFDRAEMQRCMERFDAFSVREISGVELVKREFNRDAKFLLDPVFLCKKEHYLCMMNDARFEIPEQPYYFAYILDPSPEKQKMLERITTETGINVIAIGEMRWRQDIIQKKWDYQTYNCFSGVRVEDWLRLMYNSAGVITDSFHGTCFGMLFEKKFIAIANNIRGITRFQSILDYLSLQEHLVDEKSEQFVSILQKEIDYRTVNATLAKGKEEGYAWLEENLFGSYPKKGFTDYDAATVRIDWVENDLYRRIGELEHQIEEQENTIAQMENMLFFPFKQYFTLKNKSKRVFKRLRKMASALKRKIKGGIKCYHEHGLHYTVQRCGFHFEQFVKRTKGKMRRKQ